MPQRRGHSSQAAHIAKPSTRLQPGHRPDEWASWQPVAVDGAQMGFQRGTYAPLTTPYRHSAAVPAARRPIMAPSAYGFTLLQALICQKCIKRQNHCIRHCLMAQNMQRVLVRGTNAVPVPSSESPGCAPHLGDSL
jgi:hypothetical protein